MASRSIILFLSLLSTFSFAKPSWQLIEVEDQVEADNEEKKASEEAGHEQDLDVEEEQDGKDYRQVIRRHTCSDFLNSYFEEEKNDATAIFRIPILLQSTLDPLALDPLALDPLGNDTSLNVSEYMLEYFSPITLG